MDQGRFAIPIPVEWQWNGVLQYHYLQYKTPFFFFPSHPPLIASASFFLLPKKNLVMNSLPIRTHRRLLKRLRQRRMRMTRPPYILTTSSILQRQHPLRDHLTRIRAHNMNPQNPIRFRIRNKFNHPFRFEIRFRPTIRAKRESARFIFNALFFYLCLVLPDPGDFWMGIHDAGDGVVVDVAVAFGDVFDAGDSFFFGFVREHGAEGAVADYADVGQFGPVLFVDY